MQLRPVVLAALLGAAPSFAAAQQAVALADAPVPPPSLTVRFDASLVGASLTPDPASYLSAPATAAMGRRSPWLIPSVGALAGAGGLSGWFAYACAKSDGCMIKPGIPALVGGAAGGVAGPLVEWAVQGFEGMKQAPSQPGT